MSRHIVYNNEERVIFMKNSSTRLLSFVLAVMMLFSAFTTLASAKEIEVAETSASITGGEVFYLKPNSNWTQANAWFAAYFFNNSTGQKTWLKMTACPNDAGYYKVTAPTGNWANVIFCRMNPASTTLDWTNKWNQTGDLVWNGTSNLCTINAGQWEGGMNVTWGKFTETGGTVVDPTLQALYLHYIIGTIAQVLLAMQHLLQQVRHSLLY